MMQMLQALIAEPVAEPGLGSYARDRAMIVRSNVLRKIQRLKFEDAYPRRRVDTIYLYGKPRQ